MTDYAYNKGADITYGTILMIIVLFGTPGNIFSLNYFCRKPKKTTSTIIYIFVTGVDILLCLCALPTSLSYYTSRAPGMFSSRFFCNSWIVVYKVCSAMAIFCVALLSMTRTYLLRYPFRRVSQRGVVGVLVSYFLFLCVVSTIMFWEPGGHFVYHDGYVECSMGAANITKYEELSDVLTKMIYTFPIFPILCSCFMSCHTLWRDLPRAGAAYRPGSQEKRHASETIIMFTLVYAVFSIPASVLNLMAFKEGLLGRILEFDKEGYFGNFVWSLSIPLNSLCNPLLYIFRMPNIRTSILQVVGIQKDSDTFESVSGKHQKTVTYL